MAKTVAITGANGFVGRNAAKYLSEKGFKIKSIVRDKSKAAGLEFSEIVVINDFLDIEALAKTFSGADYVIHLVGISRENPSDITFEKINHNITSAVVEACGRANVKKIIYNSGLGVANYGKKNFTTNDYFLSKLNAERAIVESRINYTIFRPSYIIGIGDELTPSLIERLKNNKSIEIIGDGLYRMQPIFVGDVAKIYAGCFKKADKQIFDLVGPQKISFLDYVNLIAKKLNLKSKFKHISVEKAKSLGNFSLSKEEIDVLVCDETSDHKILEKTFEIKLKTPKEIIDLF